jgi:predicted enzyme related to lactoylglutathione lyase
MPAPTLVLGAPCWIDLFTSDTEKAKEFYGELFGWKAEAPEEGFGGYFVFSKDGKVVAGCMANDGEQGYPDAWTTYLTTDDVERTADAATANGGQVHLAPMDVADNGKMAMVGDPGQAAIGVWQPGTQKGFEIRNEAGSAAWFELHTRAYDASVAFYRDVFGWDTHTMSDTPEFRYTTLGEGEGQLAGIMDASGYLPEGTPAFWTIYFDVADTDAALEKIVELGGSVIEPAEDTPYGRLATAADPTGTRFKLVAGPQA